MTSSKSDNRPGEFEVIRTLFAPLSRDLPGAFELSDDVAILAPPIGHEVVLKTDAIVEGVHFRKTDDPETIAKKALRVNISDFAAKGATPRAYLLALALPDWPDMAWLRRFAAGLAEDQAQFGVTLVGGDTVRTTGPVTISITMTGFVQGTMIRRDGARPGDIVCVTGTIGDAGGGLEILGRQIDVKNIGERELVSRYFLPRPRLALGQKLRGLASAALDVSDGLIADLGHIAEVSRVRIEIDADRIPLSDALRELRGADVAAIVRAATSGDDYEIAFTASPARLPAIMDKSRETQTCVTEVGRVGEGAGVVLLDTNGREVPVAHKGYTHF